MLTATAAAAAVAAVVVARWETKNAESSTVVCLRSNSPQSCESLEAFWIPLFFNVATVNDPVLFETLTPTTYKNQNRTAMTEAGGLGFSKMPAAHSVTCRSAQRWCWGCERVRQILRIHLRFRYSMGSTVLHR